MLITNSIEFVKLVLSQHTIPHRYIVRLSQTIVAEQSARNLAVHSDDTVHTGASAAITERHLWLRLSVERSNERSNGDLR